MPDLERLTQLELARIARRLKIPVKHVVNYHWFMHGSHGTQLDRATKRYINDKMSVFKFKAMDDAVGLNRGTSERTTTQ